MRWPPLVACCKPMGARPMQHNPRLIDAARQALLWLTPDFETAAARARAAQGALALADELTRALLRAGLIERPTDPMARDLLALRDTIETATRDLLAEAMAETTNPN